MIISCLHFLNTYRFRENKYLKPMAYPQSKLAQVISTVYLNSKFKKENIPIEVFAANPGAVNTDMVLTIDLFNILEKYTKMVTYVIPLLFKVNIF